LFLYLLDELNPAVVSILHSIVGYGTVGKNISKFLIFKNSAQIISTTSKRSFNYD